MLMTIHPVLLDIFHRNAVSKLPDQKREIYQFIVDMEHHLEDIAVDEKQFLQLMIERSPFKVAAAHFSLEIPYVKLVMDEAQKEINGMVDERCNRMEWIDCTDMIRHKKNYKENQWLFVFQS